MAIQPFQKKVWLSTPTMHGEEQKWVEEAIRTNWVSTVGENINEVERLVTEKIGRRYAVGLSNGTAALHLAVRLAGEKRSMIRGIWIPLRWNEPSNFIPRSD